MCASENFNLFLSSLFLLIFYNNFQVILFYLMFNIQKSIVVRSHGFVVFFMVSVLRYSFNENNSYFIFLNPVYVFKVFWTPNFF